MGNLFHFNTGNSTSRSSSSKNADVEETGNDSDGFHPIPQNSSSRSKKKFLLSNTPRVKSEKGKYPAKRKVKECRLKIVILPQIMLQIPPPRKRHMEEVWVPVSASEDELNHRFRTAFGWREYEKPQYLYAQGKSIRPAALADVQGAESWDVESVHALMGNGCLYVVKVDSHVSTASDSETEVSGI